MTRPTHQLAKQVRKLQQPALAAVGGVALAIGLGFALHAVSAAPAATSGPVDAKGNPSQYSNAPMQAHFGKHAAVTDRRTFYIGDTITMPNGLKLQVTQLQRNWQPPALVQATLGQRHTGDNPTGREVVLVWFTASNVGTSPIQYSDNLFSLQTKGGIEQRVAHLSTLPFNSMGAHGVNPWLYPGESATTFVPFLVSPGSTTVSFQYYAYPPVTGAVKGQPFTDAMPAIIHVTLAFRPQGQATSSANSQTSTSFTFQPDTSTTYGS